MAWLAALPALAILGPVLPGLYWALAPSLDLSVWRARCKLAGLNQREMAVTFPGPVGEVLALDIDMVLQQDPIDWTSQHAG